MMQHVLDPGEVGIADRRHPILPPKVVTQSFAAPLANVERWIGKDEVGAQVRVHVVLERVTPLWAEVGFDSAQREVHLRQPPSSGVLLLSEHRDVAAAPAVRFDELLSLYEHTAGAASGIEDAPV